MKSLRGNPDKERTCSSVQILLHTGWHWALSNEGNQWWSRPRDPNPRQNRWQTNIKERRLKPLADTKSDYKPAAQPGSWGRAARGSSQGKVHNAHFAGRSLRNISPYSALGSDPSPGQKHTDSQRTGVYVNAKKKKQLLLTRIRGSWEAFASAFNWVLCILKVVTNCTLCLPEMLRVQFLVHQESSNLATHNLSCMNAWNMHCNKIQLSNVSQFQSSLQMEI